MHTAVSIRSFIDLIKDVIYNCILLSFYAYNCIIIWYAPRNPHFLPALSCTLYKILYLSKVPIICLCDNPDCSRSKLSELLVPQWGRGAATEYQNKGDE